MRAWDKPDGETRSLERPWSDARAGDKGEFRPGPARVRPAAESGPDSHVSFERAQESAVALQCLGVEADFRRSPGMPPIINQDEMDACRMLLRHLVAPSEGGL